MPKKNVKFPEKLPTLTEVPPVIETAEEAIAEAERQLAEANIPPSSIMVTFRDGYVTGDGQVHAASGITAPPKTKPKPAEKQLQVPATESYTPVEDPSKEELLEKLEEGDETELTEEEFDEAFEAGDPVELVAPTDEQNEREWDAVRPKKLSD